MPENVIFEKHVSSLLFQSALRHKPVMKMRNEHGQMADAVTLNTAKMIGEGGGRKVYAYPGKPEFIIKTHKPFPHKPFHHIRRRLRFMGRRFGDYLHSIIEAEEYTAMIARMHRIPDFVPGYRGMVMIEGQVGAVFDAIREPDGAISPTLQRFVARNGYSPSLEAAIDHLWSQVMTFRCVVSDPNLGNVLVQSRADGILHLWLVDGLGERTLIPIMRLSDRVFLRNTRRFHAEMISAAKQLAVPRG